MIIPKLAIKNLLGAGLRTWLNVFVLSLSFITIIWTQGLYRGMDRQVSRIKIDSEIGGGQYWQEKYDPFDPVTLDNAHGEIPVSLKNLIDHSTATPILITSGTIYPNGRIMTVMLKGITPEQTVLDFPAELLKNNEDELPALIGSRMAKSCGLKIGDYVTIRWRDKNGTFDARDAKIKQIMSTQVQTLDNAQVWLPLQKLQQMTGMENQATIITIAKKFQNPEKISGWNFRDHDYLLNDLKQMLKTKSVGASFMYTLLLFLAMLAIFDTQILSIFRRRKEMGTLMALGMTRRSLIQLFTLEGAIHGVLAAGMAAIYGIPLMTYTAKTGWALPKGMDNFGFAIGEKLFPSYTVGLVVGTTLLVLFVTTVVSYLPTRKIAKLKPTDALRGKLS